MNATQARTLTISSSEDLMKELNRIFECIADAASDGKNKLYLSPVTEKVIINHLVYDFGFITETEESNNETVTLCISW